MTVLGAVTTEREGAAHSAVMVRRAGRSRGNHALRSLAIDVMAASAATAAMFGWLARDADGAWIRLREESVSDLSVIVAAGLLPVAWAVALFAHRGYERGALGVATSANRQVIAAAVSLTAATPLVCVAARRAGLVGVAALAIQLAAALTMAGRRVVAAWERAVVGDAALVPALVVGHAAPVAALVPALLRGPARRMRVVGVCLADPGRRELLDEYALPVGGGLDDVSDVARRMGCELVVVAHSARLDDVRLRRLAWDLADAGVGVIVAPPLAGAARRRVRLAETGGRLVLQISAPNLSGPAWFVKAAVDRALAAVLVLLAAPLMLVIAISIRLTSSGPALFRQRRVGRRGEEFVCLKFRTMTVDAQERREELAHLNERGEGVLFKIRNDPRVTGVGSFLRRSSLDELPQLINILRGEMSLVGPRPALPSEVAAYDDDVRRRLRVRPGLTGLWQVSGRAELPWPEAVRLDLSYVDNWSPALDVSILLRTAAAVVRGTGAY